MNDLQNISFDEASDFCEAKFQSVEIVLNFAEKHKDSIYSVFSLGSVNNPTNPHREMSIEGLWYRVYCWLQSLQKLNSARDFQAFATANRALFEITVDLAILHNDKTNSSGWRLWNWNLSEKLRSAKNLTEYFVKNKIDVPDIYAEQIEFIRREEDSILHMRKMLWASTKNPDGRHPQRWTGNPNLFEELHNVDSILGQSVIELFDMPLAQYYRTEYAKMNWFIHSGVSSFWKMPQDAFPTISAFFLEGCANFGLLATHIVLKDLGLTEHLPNYYEELNNLKNARLFTHSNYIDKWASDSPNTPEEI